MLSFGCQKRTTVHFTEHSEYKWPLITKFYDKVKDCPTFKSVTDAAPFDKVADCLTWKKGEEISNIEKNRDWDKQN